MGEDYEGDVVARSIINNIELMGSGMKKIVLASNISLTWIPSLFNWVTISAIQKITHGQVCWWKSPTSTSSTSLSCGYLPTTSPPSKHSQPSICPTYNNSTSVHLPLSRQQPYLLHSSHKEGALAFSPHAQSLYTIYYLSQ